MDINVIKHVLVGISVTFLAIYIPFRDYYKNKQYFNLVILLFLAVWLFAIVSFNGPSLKRTLREHLKAYSSLSFSQREKIFESQDIYETTKIIQSYVPSSSKILIIYSQDYLSKHSQDEFAYWCFRTNYKIYPVRPDYAVLNSETTIRLVDFATFYEPPQYHLLDSYIPNYQYIIYFQNIPTASPSSFSKITSTESIGLWKAYGYK